MWMLTSALSVAEAVVLSCCTSSSRSQKPEEETRELPTKVGSDLVEKFHLQRNRRASASLSPVLVHFLEPHGKLYLRLQVRVPENESIHLLVTLPPKTLASSINIPDALFPGANGANGHPKEPAQGYHHGLTLR